MAAAGSPAPWDKKLVGGRIVALRRAKGWNAAQFAHLIDVTPQKLNNYERGRDGLPHGVAGKICALTGADFDYLFRGLQDRLGRDLVEALSRAAESRENAPVINVAAKRPIRAGRQGTG